MASLCLSVVYVRLLVCHEFCCIKEEDGQNRFNRSALREAGALLLDSQMRDFVCVRVCVCGLFSD